MRNKLRALRPTLALLCGLIIILAAFNVGVTNAVFSDTQNAHPRLKAGSWAHLEFDEEDFNCEYDGEDDCGFVSVVVRNTGQEAMAGPTPVDLWYAASGSPQTGERVVILELPALGPGEEALLVAAASRGSGVYQFMLFQLPARPEFPSPGLLWSNEIFVDCSACDDGDDNCTLTQGYWENHPEDWPVSSITIGDVTLGKDDALVVLGTPPEGDATYILAHQLIAAKLNIANGADPSAVASEISAADAWLTAHPLGSDPGNPDREEGIAPSETLDDYNNGDIGPGHCDDKDDKECKDPEENGCHKDKDNPKKGKCDDPKDESCQKDEDKPKNGKCNDPEDEGCKKDEDKPKKEKCDDPKDAGCDDINGDDDGRRV